jgi:hypothetical protein
MRSLFLFLMLLLAGCAESRQITKEDALAVAKQEVRKRNWPSAKVVSINFTNGLWEVNLERTPSSFGGEATVVISARGKVVRYVPGL